MITFHTFISDIILSNLTVVFQTFHQKWILRWRSTFQYFMRYDLNRQHTYSIFNRTIKNFFSFFEKYRFWHFKLKIFLQIQIAAEMFDRQNSSFSNYDFVAIRAQFLLQAKLEGLQLVPVYIKSGKQIFTQMAFKHFLLIFLYESIFTALLGGVQKCDYRTTIFIWAVSDLHYVVFVLIPGFRRLKMDYCVDFAQFRWSFGISRVKHDQNLKMALFKHMYNRALSAFRQFGQNHKGTHMKNIKN